MFHSPADKSSLWEKQCKGFTFVELIVVSAIAMVLMGLSAPFITALRSDISMKESLNQVKTDIVTTMGYALAGKSIGALASGNLADVSLIPSHYALFFQKDDDYGDVSPYYYTEYTTDINLNQRNTKLTYKVAKDMPSSTVFLKDIRLRKNETETGQSVNAAFIFFSAPLAKVNLLSGQKNIILNSGYSFDSMNDFKNSDFKYVDLVFQFKDDEKSQTILTFGVDKVINIS